jgi:hypothetical protein
VSTSGAGTDPELIAAEVIAMAMLYGMHHTTSPAQAADVILAVLLGAGWVVVRADDVRHSYATHVRTGCTLSTALCTLDGPA